MQLGQLTCLHIPHRVSETSATDSLEYIPLGVCLIGVSIEDEESSVMFFRQHHVSCPSHASYRIDDTTMGRAVVVPRRASTLGVVI